MVAIPATAADAYGQPDDDAASTAGPKATGPQPGQMVSLPDLPQHEVKRRKRIAEACKAYEGDWGAGPLKIKKDGEDENVRPNMVQPIVDVGVNFLFGETLKIELANDTDSETGEENDVDNGAQTGTSPAQAFLDDCWGDDDDKMTLLTKLATNGAIAGTAFVMIDPAPTKGKTLRKGKASKKPLPRVVLLDPANVMVIADPHDCETAIAYWVQYEVDTYNSRGEPEVYTYRKVICRNDPDGLASTTGLGYDDDDSWIILDFMRKGLTGASRSHNSGMDQGQGNAWKCLARTEWPSPWPPIVACQNLPNPNEYHGLPDLSKDLIQLNRALIFNESNIASIIKYYAAPARWASGVTAANLKLTNDGIMLFQSENAKLNALDVKADLANAMAFSERLQSAMDEQSQIPGIALGRMKDIPRGTISGPVFQGLYKPPTAKTIKKQRLYGRLIREVSQHLLELGGFAEASDANIELHWKDVMPSDALIEAQAAQIWSGLGVSNDALMQKYTTFNPDIEAVKKQQEGMRQVMAYSQGQGLPPMPPNMANQQQPSQASPDASTATSDGATPPGGASQGQQGNAPPINHPAAQLQRAKMAATAKR
ncbi:MAG TPA: phage portal protein [Ktedonobacterales bacterium]|nr:phage portal protein [Ktedonobacterales bacterium]